MIRLDIIQKYINYYNYSSYLEIGIDRGQVFNNVKIEFKESVDPGDGSYYYANPTYKMTSDVFFTEYPNKKYDIIFIDGLHESQQLDRDIANSIKALNSNGTILLHDCNPPTKLSQQIPRNNIGLWCGDVWKSIVKFNYYNHTKFNTFVIDTDLGVGVIQESKGTCKYTLPDLLDYKWLELNRKQALNLKSIHEFLNLFT
jgi:hypothetical protein